MKFIFLLVLIAAFNANARELRREETAFDDIARDTADTLSAINLMKESVEEETAFDDILSDTAAVASVEEKIHKDVSQPDLAPPGNSFAPPGTGSAAAPPGNGLAPPGTGSAAAPGLAPPGTGSAATPPGNGFTAPQGTGLAPRDGLSQGNNVQQCFFTTKADNEKPEGEAVLDESASSAARPPIMPSGRPVPPLRRHTGI